jgi:hypothetical protein
MLIATSMHKQTLHRPEQTSQHASKQARGMTGARDERRIELFFGAT